MLVVIVFNLLLLASATIILSVDEPVSKPVIAKVLLALVTIVVGAVNVPPNFTLPLVTLKPLSAVFIIFTAVAFETPFTVDTN